MMANNYFSADVQSSQYSLNNYNSSSKIKDRKELIQEQHVPKLFNKKSVNLLEQNPGAAPERKKKFLVTKRNSHQVKQLNQINFAKTGYKSPPLAILKKHTEYVNPSLGKVGESMA